MSRDNAKKILVSPDASREEVCQAIMWLSTELRYILNSMGANPAQETQADIKESRELLDQLQARLSTLE